MKGLRLLKRLGRALRPPEFRETYSQCGEDRIIVFLFDLLGITRPNYLDIGANHPTHLSNTYLLYSQGSRGVCIEPNPLLHDVFKARRPLDICLNIGIAAHSHERLEFYIFDDPAMSTFSSAVKEGQLAVGRLLQETRFVEVRSVNDVIAEYFTGEINFVSLDTEGFDFAILRSWNFELRRPAVFCIETITYVDQRKMTEIIDYMASQNYVIYADTYINTIFVDQERWSASLSWRHS